jgi:predicted kinase
VSSPPLLVVVTGAPASGKTDVAERLAESLRIPFVVKDTFKETLYETIGSNDGLEETIDRSALAILFRVVEAQLAAGVAVVAESNFDSSTDPEPFRRICAERPVRIVQIHCRRDEDVLLERFARRAASGERHPGHRDRPADVDEVRRDLEAGRWDPLDLPGTLIEFDKDREDEAELVTRVRAAATE